MKICDVYKKYEIPPNLQEHMFRVAGIGCLIATNWIEERVDVDLVVRTCLLHDMGNIIKFDLSDATAKKFKLENVKYWRKVQKKFINKYGKDSHEATYGICEELKQHDVLEILKEESYVYNHAQDKILETSPESQILLYSDVRVVPLGVVPLKTRIDDLHNRYGNSYSHFDFLYVLEKFLQEKSKIDVVGITEESVKLYFPKFGKTKIA